MMEVNCEKRALRVVPDNIKAIPISFQAMFQVHDSTAILGIWDHNTATASHASNIPQNDIGQGSGVRCARVSPTAFALAVL